MGINHLLLIVLVSCIAQHTLTTLTLTSDELTYISRQLIHFSCHKTLG